MQNENPQTTLVLGGGPAGLTAGYLLGKAGRDVVVFEAEDQVGGLAKTVESRRLSLRPRRAPLLHEGARGRRPLARDPRRRVSAAPAHVAHLLEQPLPRLPAARRRRDQEARPGRARALHGLVPARRREARQGRRVARGLGDEPVRQAPLRALLQDVQREGLGRTAVRDPRRVGRAADQGPVVLLRGEGGVLRQQGQQGQEPDLGVQLPALRARARCGTR